MPEDRWQDAAAYDQFMGRWSRVLSTKFLAWLDLKPQAHWLEVGCGTGSLTAEILRRSRPQSLTACDTATDFVDYCAATLSAENLQVIAVPAGVLPLREGGYDAVVSSLVLNFLRDPTEAVRRMGRSCAPGGVVAACVWDYSDRMEFLRLFWDAAVDLDPGAADLHEGRRFPLCRDEALRSCFAAAQLEEISVDPITIPTVFTSFDDYWNPFLNAAGPAPTYVASLSPQARRRLRDRLHDEIRTAVDGSIHLRARAWAVKGRPSL